METFFGKSQKVAEHVTRILNERKISHVTLLNCLDFLPKSARSAHLFIQIENSRPHQRYNTYITISPYQAILYMIDPFRIYEMNKEFYTEFNNLLSEFSHRQIYLVPSQEYMCIVCSTSFGPNMIPHSFLNEFDVMGRDYETIMQHLERQKRTEPEIFPHDSFREFKGYLEGLFFRIGEMQFVNECEARTTKNSGIVEFSIRINKLQTFKVAMNATMERSEVELSIEGTLCVDSTRYMIDERDKELALELIDFLNERLRWHLDEVAPTGNLLLEDNSVHYKLAEKLSIEDFKEIKCEKIFTFLGLSGKPFKGPLERGRIEFFYQISDYKSSFKEKHARKLMLKPMRKQFVGQEELERELRVISFLREDPEIEGIFLTDKIKECRDSQEVIYHFPGTCCYRKPLLSLRYSQDYAVLSRVFVYLTSNGIYIHNFLENIKCIEDKYYFCYTQPFSSYTQQTNTSFSYHVIEYLSALYSEPLPTYNVLDCLKLDIDVYSKDIEVAGMRVSLEKVEESEKLSRDFHIAKAVRCQFTRKVLGFYKEKNSGELYLVKEKCEATLFEFIERSSPGLLMMTPGIIRSLIYFIEYLIVQKINFTNITLNSVQFDLERNLKIDPIPESSPQPT